MIKKKQK